MRNRNNKLIKHQFLQGGVIHGTLLGLEHLKSGSVIVNTASDLGGQLTCNVEYPLIITECLVSILRGFIWLRNIPTTSR